VEEAAAAAGALQEQAARLADVVSVFKIGHSATPAAAPKRRMMSAPVPAPAALRLS
jgi:hypothetical protein